MEETRPEITWRDGRTYNPTDADIARFSSQITKRDDGCWEWTGYRTCHGYGQMHMGGKGGRSARVHRIAYILWRGPIPGSHELDHACHTRDESCAGGRTCTHRRCVNPDHLEPVSQRDNVLRSRSFVAKNAAKTHCYRGHEFTDENTYRYSDGRRQCRICMREHGRNQQAQMAGTPRPPSRYDRRTTQAKAS